MSLAKINQIGHVRKPGTCENCGLEIKKGDPAVRFTVGFRGYTHTRCTKPGCWPKPSERESSAVASVYAAQEEVDLSEVKDYDGFTQVRDDVATAIRDVAGEYESNEMYEMNYDLQDRAEILNSAADELENWEPDDEAPDEDDPDSWGMDETYEAAMETWLDATRESLDSAINDMELP